MDYELFGAFEDLHPNNGWFPDTKNRRAAPNMFRSAISANVDDS
jgi:hypothetical protein